MRALKTLLDRGELGEPVVAEIVMNARPHWQEFIKPYGRIALLNMSIHHLDVIRMLFGDPDRILCSVRPDPSHQVGRAQQEAFQPARIGVVIAGLEVPHLHIHLVPIDRLRDLDFANAATSVAPEDLEDAASSIRDSLRRMGLSEVSD